MSKETKSLFSYDEIKYPVSCRIIAACGSDGAVGRSDSNCMPWKGSHIGDLRHFRQKTMGHSIVMGRKTHESIGHSLAGRKNIVLTHNPESISSDVVAVDNLADAAREALYQTKGIFYVIGGCSVWKAFLEAKVVDSACITQFRQAYTSDEHIFFPFDLLDDEAEWEILTTKYIDTDEPRDDKTPVYMYQRTVDIPKDKEGWKHRIQLLKDYGSLC